VAQNNAQRLGLAHVSFFHGEWCLALPHHHFDIIVSNPPYLKETEWAEYASGLLFEPRSALLSGADGLDAIRVLCCTAWRYLKPGGMVFIEHGYLQGSAVRALFAENPYQNIFTICDLAGHERITVAEVRLD
jgi:release factor glutamine methyltransferase